ncbi:TIGR03032 family protein [Caenimonas aquaedulcis]|uniref:TIGR03032 family protein n=1 Tax=Caenimonas aquaedulcis TaxID=2793270 RepID=A0A931H0X2_9BURK|nr:TIGR03032 family protein [Caenimonas aquaedulcis]MBG9386531.1 TIGR03032 family protein [Caenimonas aquaedulcis]
MSTAIGSDGLGAWLREMGVSLACSTYRANRLIFLGRGENDSLKLHERLFDRPMGLCVDDSPGGHRLWMASRFQVWRFDNFLAPGQLHEGGDRLYVPAASFTTGDVNAHELVLQADGSPLFVNTAFSCLATLQPGSSFAPVWQPPFVDKLAAEDRCHLNGVAAVDGVPTWATACGSDNRVAGWRDERTGGGVVLHIPSNRIAATGLSMPHSPRWHEGKLWLLNSGTGELGWIEGERFVPLCFLPGFARGLAFVGRTAVVGLSKLRSPQFTGLPLEQRLHDAGVPEGSCGLRVIDLDTGAVLHQLDLPEPIDELFDVVALPGCRQPRALGLQAEDIRCLVKLPGQDPLVTVRPKAPSGNPHQAKPPPVAGLPMPGAALRYQRVLQLSPQNLAPYAGLTFPSLAPGSRGLAALKGELMGISAMADGTMVGLALAERLGDRGARLCSLMVEPGFRRQGVATRLLLNLQRLLAENGAQEAVVHYAGNAGLAASFEPLLARLGWSAPQTGFVLVQGSAARLARTGWETRYALQPPYECFPWVEATAGDLAAAKGLAAPRDLLPPATFEGVEPSASLGLRHEGALAGWLIAHRVDAGTVRYSSLYVAPSHRGRGRGLALLAEAFIRQERAGIPLAKAAVQVGNDEFMRVLHKHLNPYLDSAGESRSARIALVRQEPTPEMRTAATVQK